MDGWLTDRLGIAVVGWRDLMALIVLCFLSFMVAKDEDRTDTKVRCPERLSLLHIPSSTCFERIIHLGLPPQSDDNCH
eukprot:scaffold935_cov155-Amphora_coffeaeformis.AAC.8